MLILARRFREISFGQLMEVYMESNLIQSRAHYPDDPYRHGLLEAEQYFYTYLCDVFFKTPGALYAIWEEKGKYVSALRLEPFKDGLLLAGLETHPDHRSRGYAERLIQEVQNRLTELGTAKLYSHCDKSNTASLHVHQKCGFQILSDYAAFIDGSINRRAVTMVYEKK